MKKLILTSISFFIATTLTNAQDKQTKEPRFEAEKIEIDNKANMVTYLGNVYCIVDVLTIKKAEKIEFDNQTKKLVAYNVTEFTFDGTLSVADKPQSPTCIEYTTGHTTAFIK